MTLQTPKTDAQVLYYTVAFVKVGISQLPVQIACAPIVIKQVIDEQIVQNQRSRSASTVVSKVIWLVNALHNQHVATCVIRLNTLGLLVTELLNSCRSV